MKYILLIVLFGNVEVPPQIHIIGTYASQESCNDAKKNWPISERFNKSTNALCLKAP